MGSCLESRIELDVDEDTHSSWEGSDKDSHSSWEGSEDEDADTVKYTTPILSNSIVKPFGISQMVTYFNSDKVITVSGNGLFSSKRSSSFSNTCAFKPPLTEVTSQLYFGSFEDAMNEAQLRSHEITHIISAIGPTHTIDGIKHMHIPMNDYGRTDLKRVFKKIWPFIEESQQPGNALFVHCMSGQNRSATVVVGILMRCQGKRLDKAYRMVKKKRPLVQINEQYAKQLSLMELELFGEASVPEDWMEIRSVDMNTGKVVFSGENMSSMLSLSCARSNIEHKPNPYSMNRAGSLTVQYVD